ncbi:hypothetical protein Hanom_Chr11g01057821 [Helianthus anomalus]
MLLGVLIAKNKCYNVKNMLKLKVEFNQILIRIYSRLVLAVTWIKRGKNMCFLSLKCNSRKYL